jgi:tetratricopeptide (TPR) repeat protein
MKSYLRLIVFFGVAVSLLIVVSLVRQTTEPQSSIIDRERNRVYASRDEGRMKSDPVYASGFREKAAFLDYRLAIAYNAENKPDKALVVLQRLINDEEAKEKDAIPRRSRSYMKEADYYEALKEAFELRHDMAGVNKALDQYARLRTKALELRILEGREDGRYVGAPAD